MRLRDKISIKSFFVKQRIIRPAALSCYNELIKNQQLSFEDLAELNWRKRLCLLQHSYDTVPYYRRKYQEVGLSPADVVQPGDWQRVPLLTKDEIIRHHKELISSTSKQSDRAISTTGGSTGNPIKVFHDRRYPVDTLGWRMLSWWNLSPGTDAAYVWRLTRTTSLSRFSNQLIWYPTRRIFMDASSMSIAGLRVFISKFNKLRPTLLQGYLGAIHHLAQFIEAEALSIHSPVAIWVTSSPVSGVQRRLIERVFNAPLYNQYGCGEIFWLAAECKDRSGLHIFADARHIEFIDDLGTTCVTGQIGKVAVTDLENFAFPIIRYLNGDVGRQLPGACQCGMSLPLMDSIKGRVTDLIRLPDGTVLSGDYLSTIFDEFPDAVCSFQVLQKADYSIIISVVPNASFEKLEDILMTVKTVLRHKTYGLVPVRFEKLDEIPTDRGKTRFVISEVSRP